MTTAADEAIKQRARDYLRSHGTEASPAVIRRRLATAVETLHGVLESADAVRARRRAWPEEWSLHEIADHVVETHRACLEELHCLLAGRRPPDGPVPASLQSAEPLARPWKDLLAELRHIHSETLAKLDAAPSDLPADVRAPFVMVVNRPEGPPLEWQDEVDWKGYVVTLRLHALDHAGQARKVLAALSP